MKPTQGSRPNGIILSLDENTLFVGDVGNKSITKYTLATDGSDPERQMEAIQGLGIAGGDEVGKTLVSVFRSSNSDDVKTAALNG